MNTLTLEKKQERRDFRKKIFTIAIPIMLSSIVTQLEMLVDRMFLSNLDITCISAVGNASSPIWTSINFGMSLSLGAVILISHAVGSNDFDKAKSYTASLFKYANVYSVILFLVWMFLPRIIFNLMGVDSSIIDMSIDYARYISPMMLIIGLGASVSGILEVSSKTKILVIYGLVRSITNVFLDYGLIFGNYGLPKMGVAGAALATALAEYVGAIIVLIYFLYDSEISLKPKFSEILKAKLHPYIESIRKGLPAALEDFAWNIGSIFLIVMLNRISPEAAGIYTIVFSVELLPICAYGSLSNAVLTLSGQETGKGKPQNIKTLVGISVFWSCVMGAIILLMFIIIPEQIIGLFTNDKAIISVSTIYLLIVGIDLFPKSTNISIGAGIRGYGDTRWMLLTQCFGTVFVIVGSAILVLVFNQGIGALFMLVVADEVLRSIINYFKLRKISSI